MSLSIGDGLVNNTSPVNQDHSPILGASAPSPETKQEPIPQTNQLLLPTPVTEKLVVIGSGLAGYSAAIAACANSLSPLLITGSSLGGRLPTSGSLDYWPGAAAGAKGYDMVVALHAQATRLGVRFINDNVKSISTEAKPYAIATEHSGTFAASAVIIATGLTPKTVGLDGESELLGRGVFNTAATMCGPHKHVAVIGNGSQAVIEALELAESAFQVTLVCDAPSLTCSPSLLTRLSSVTNVKVECEASVLSLIVDPSQ